METLADNKRKKAKSLVALTSIIGIGAVATLAAWTATTYMRGSVTTGNLSGIQSSTDGGSTWSAITDTSSSPQPITFTGGTALAPNETAYASFKLRTASGTTVAVPVEFITSVVSGSGTGINYSIIQSSTCTSASTGTTVVASTTVPGTAVTTLTLPAGTSGSFGTAVDLCLKVTPDSTVSQNVTPQILWAASAKF